MKKETVLTLSADTDGQRTYSVDTVSATLIRAYHYGGGGNAAMIVERIFDERSNSNSGKRDRS